MPSPDGRLIAIVVAGEGTSAIWLRRLNSPAAYRLDKTEGADYPFWSPDGKYIGFFAENKLKKIPAEGGTPLTLCDAKPTGGLVAAGTGASWGKDGVIVFSPGPASPLRRVAAGGAPTPMGRLESGETERSWPQFLPDGKRYIYWSRRTDPASSGIYVQELAGGAPTLVLKTPCRAMWTPPGYLLFVREGGLFAQRVDGKLRPVGEPASVANDITVNEINGRAAFAVSTNGMLAYRIGSARSLSQLAWFGRDGARIAAAGKASDFRSLRLSPDGRSVEVLGPGQSGSTRDIWAMDLATGVMTRATNDGNETAVLGPWSPDSQRVALNSLTGEGVREFTVASGKLRTLAQEPLYVYDWSPDGSFLLVGDPATGKRLWKLPLEPGGKLEEILAGEERKISFRFAPDGKAVAYTSNRSGRPEVMVAAFPSFAENRQVSVDGGEYPAWRADGKELFFETRDGMIMSADIRTQPRIEAGVPRPLFKIRPLASVGYGFWPAPDGKRFLLIEGLVKSEPPAFTVVLNWQAELKQ